MSALHCRVEDYFEAAARLVQSAGLGRLDALAPLDGGGNNRVLLATLTNGNRFLVKAYFYSPEDQRDRFFHERTFHEVAVRFGIECVPKAFGWDESTRLALYEFLEGSKLRSAEVGSEAVAEAACFFAQLNRSRESLPDGSVPKASEACFSIADHLRLINGRVERLCLGLPDASMDSEVAGWISGELLPRWEGVRATLEERGCSEPEWQTPLEPPRWCLSPSDFGFHNAIQAGRGLVFFDFEYAGWDDPAKMACDFFCQPEAPPPLAEFDSFLAATLLSGWDLATYRKRVRLLLPAYRIKWACIILNVFVSTHVTRRKFANPALASEQARRTQWEKAIHQLQLANQWS